MPEWEPNLKRTVVNFGSWITGIGLILLATQCLVYDGAANGYGVSPIDENGTAYLLATGMRDLALGVMTIFFWARFRTSLAVYFLIMTIVPIADTLIVLRYGNGLIHLVPHVVGIIGLLTISIFAYLEPDSPPVDKGEHHGDET